MIKTSIIIPVFNRAILTKRCLLDLIYLDESYEIVIINNNSTDNTIEEIQAVLKDNMRMDRPMVKILTALENLGFARAQNWGYGMSIGDNVIFLNNDIRVSSKYTTNWAKMIIDELDRSPNTLISPTGGMIDSKYNFMYETEDPNKKWNYLSGWLLAGKRETFDKFASDEAHKDEMPFPIFMKTYFEDTWLSFRARKLGIKMKLLKVPVVHLKRQTSKRMNVSEMYTSARKKFIKKCDLEGLK